MKLDAIYYLEDDSPAPGAFQMALDEALFHYSSETGKPLIRFYQWDRPAVTFGYSEPYPAQAGEAPIRRFTGGGKVEHGEDLTFLLTLPRGTAPAKLAAEARYRWVHEAVLSALLKLDVPLVAEELPRAQETGPCFENPVTWDLISTDSGEKVVGGAQRRSRGNIIHQGSIRIAKNLRSKHSGCTASMIKNLATAVFPFPEDDLGSVFDEAKKLREERYETSQWNRRRQ